MTLHVFMIISAINGFEFINTIYVSHMIWQVQCIWFHIYVNQVTPAMFSPIHLGKVHGGEKGPMGLYSLFGNQNVC